MSDCMFIHMSGHAQTCIAKLYFCHLQHACWLEQQGFAIVKLHTIPQLAAVKRYHHTAAAIVLRCAHQIACSDACANADVLLS